MHNHLARRGGIWWVRLAVPKRLRNAAGRCEFTRSTRTSELHIAKLVAARYLAEWRLQLLRLESEPMNPELLKLVEPAPSLAIGVSVSLQDVEGLGLSRAEVLRMAARSERLRMYVRMSAVSGHLVPEAALDLDPATGGYDLPLPQHMPDVAIQTIQTGACCIHESKHIAGVFLAGEDRALILSFKAPGRDGWLFVPDEPMSIHVEQLEFEARAIRHVRQRKVSTLTEADLSAIAEHRRREMAPAIVAVGPSAPAESRMPFTAAVEAYCTEASGLPSRLRDESEQRHQRGQLLQFAEFMGDLPIGDIKPATLRAFRDGPLRTFLGKVNHIPRALKRDTMKAQIEALAAAGREWPLMSDGAQQERMQILARFFEWATKSQGWLKDDPAEPLSGESGQTRAQRAEARQRAAEARRESGEDEDEEGRQPFTDEELGLIFSQPHFQNGDGRHVTKGNQSWYPFEYWLPLIGAYAGCRISEVSQLHLSDVRQVQGVWVLDINEASPDKRTKTDNSSVRRIPVHPHLIELGFLAYCDRLRAEGFRRVFPELTFSNTPARYAKEGKRKMSVMLETLGMPRDGTRVFHNFRHNANNQMARVPMSALPYADEQMRLYIRLVLMGHAVPNNVNAQHYMHTPMSERAALIAGVSYNLPSIAPFSVEAGVVAVRKALAKKLGDRRGREDMGPLNESIYGR